MSRNTVQEHSTIAQIEDVDVVFDLDTLTLVGRYRDQLSAYRAKRIWMRTLQDCFLLDRETDISLKVSTSNDKQHFLLVCEFQSSCARYAFWRLTNNHVPEAAYVLETAHLPESKDQNYAGAPDLRALVAPDLRKFDMQVSEQKSLLKKLGDLTKTFVKSL